MPSRPSRTGSTHRHALFGNRAFPGANAEHRVPLANGSVVNLRVKDFIRYKGVAVFLAPSMKALSVLSADL